MIKDGFSYCVKIDWNDTDWNTLCADVMEVFGLPGNRYMCQTSVDYMIFMFKSEKDKQLCTLLLSEYI